MNRQVISAEPTDADIDCQSFRIIHRAGNVCCEMHHFQMITWCLVGDYRDSDEMARRVRGCESLREFGMQHGWMRELVENETRNCDAGHSFPLLGKYLKNTLDI